MKKQTRCRSGTYTENIVLHGGLMCFGGFGQPPCKYLIDCLEDFRGKGIISDRKINNIKKKIGK
jgi:hypothetical protein